MEETQAQIEQVDADFDTYVDSWELTSEKCPNEGCGGTLSTAFFAQSHDDYTQKWRCDTCHEIFDE